MSLGWGKKIGEAMTRKRPKNDRRQR